jgi:hypothetical protein
MSQSNLHHIVATTCFFSTISPADGAEIDLPTSSNLDRSTLVISIIRTLNSGYHRRPFSLQIVPKQRLAARFEGKMVGDDTPIFTSHFADHFSFKFPQRSFPAQFESKMIGASTSIPNPNSSTFLIYSIFILYLVFSSNSAKYL